MTFTRGPWKIGATVNGYGTAVVSATEALWYQSPGGMVPLLICSMAARSKDAYPEMGANAALIAAAPDLLAACHAVMELVEQGNDPHRDLLEWTDVYDRIANAVYKATQAERVKQWKPDY